MLFKALLAIVSLVSYAQAHAAPSAPFANHPAEISKRQLEMNKRHVMARNCASQVAAFQKHRKAKRALRRRALIEKRATMECVDKTSTTAASETTATADGATTTEGISTTDSPTTTDLTTTSGVATSTLTAITPHYSTIQNFTCVTSPEVTEGPYYLRDDYVRQDIREDQIGTTLYLDIGVLDMATCQPATDVFVEIWSCNARGEYSAFGGGSTTNGTTGGGGGSPPNVTDSVSATGAPTIASGSGGFTPSGTASMPFPSGGGGPGGGSPPTTGKANGDNFLRGGYTVNENGVVEITTIYPGFYTGRTVHIHTMVHQNISYHSNGTIISSSGALRHIGQIFFDEALNEQILAQEAYTGTGQSRTYNSADGILEQANEGGYSAFAQVEMLGDTFDEGLLGYITLGIDTTASYNISTTNYWDPDFGSEVAE